MGYIKTARNYATNYTAQRFGPNAGKVAAFLLKKATKSAKAVVAPSSLLKGTALKSYLDRSYQKKCGVEVKEYEIVSNFTVGTTIAAAFNPLEGQIAQGLTDQNRIGAKVEIKQIKFRFTFNNAAASTCPTRLRLIVLKLGEMNGTNPAASLVLQTGTNIRSQYTQENDQTRNFTIVKDKLIKLSGLNSGDSNVVKDWSWNYRPKGCHSLEFNSSDTAGTLANMTRGNFLFYMMYESLPTVTQVPSVNVYARVQYIDV